MTPEAAIIQSLFMIADKEGKDVNFVLNPAQARLDDELSGRDIVPKARQEGITSYFLARYLAACLSRRNVRAVVISHDIESTQRMLSRVRYYIEHIRGPKPVLQNLSKNEITFPKTNSMFYIGTAGAKKFGRGDTITHLHCSEYAYWSNPLELMTGLLQAVPLTGEIAVESTGNGVGNDYHRRCMRAASGASSFRLHFFPWHTFPEYKLPVTREQAQHIADGLNPAWEEPKLQDTLTAGQMAWRRQKLEELDYDLKKFKQEYPMTLDECFQSSGSSLFSKVQYVPTDMWKQREANLFILDGHPRMDKTYVIGGDVAGGVEQDYSVAQIFCLEDAEQVGEYRSNVISPDTFGEKLVYLGKMFNDAMVAPEVNNHGIVTVKMILDRYPTKLLYKEPKRRAEGEARKLVRYGVKTTATTKPLMIGQLRSRLASDLLIHSPVLYSELSTFIEHDTGELAAADGCHDDSVMASACAVLAWNRAALVRGEIRQDQSRDHRDPFTLESIIDEMANRRRNFPIRPQHATADVKF